MSDAQKAIAEVIRIHDCDWRGTESDHREHLATEIDKALGGLTREWGVRMHGDDEITIGSEETARYCAEQHPLTWTALSRLVGGWTPTDTP